MIKTSYFNNKKLNNIHRDDIFSIAMYQPPGFDFQEYKALAPNEWFLKKYKQDGDEDFYTEQYIKEVLNILDPVDVYEDIGPNGVLVCWEGKGKFCHRQLVAKWLEDKLGIKVEEL